MLICADVSAWGFQEDTRILLHLQREHTESAADSEDYALKVTAQ
jgi:hypothetical protein